jgi:hypothetical protein
MDVLIFYLKYASSMILGIEDGNNDDPNENNEVDDTLPAIAVIRHVHQMMMVRASIMESTEVANRRRRPALFDDRLHWSTFLNKFGNRVEFKRHIRVSPSSFNKLVDLLRPSLLVDKNTAELRGGPICPEICVYACLRFLAGGSYTDIKFFTGMSTPSLYRIVWKCIHAIIICVALEIIFPSSTDEVKAAAEGFSSISKERCIWNCVGVIDGYHLEIKPPSKSEVRNVKSFFSGDYQTHGVNVQAACDHHCRFVFMGVAGPCVMGDRDAIQQVALNKLVEALPGLYCAIADCAYSPSEHLVPIYRGSDAAIPRNDNFNFYASQLRIRIEMAFGLMVMKSGILARPLSVKVRKLKYLMIGIARLHNFCINERLACGTGAVDGLIQNRVFTPSAHVKFSDYIANLRDRAAEFEFEELRSEYENPWSNNRERMAREIESLCLTRPGCSSYG